MKQKQLIQNMQRRDNTALFPQTEQLLYWSSTIIQIKWRFLTLLN